MTVIRRMNLQDVDAVFIMGVNEPRFKVSSENGFWTKDQLSRWVENEKDVLLIAEEEGKIVGCALSQYHSQTNKATFENLYVNPDCRNSGIGNLLVSELIQIYQDRNSSLCALIEPDNKPILSLLEKNSFERGKEMIWMSYGNRLPQ
jgi:ribosomal protein S18 acetylase RimI-like enzyme